MSFSKSSIGLQNWQTGASVDVIGNGSVLWSSGTKWGGVIAEAYHFDELNTPEFQPVNHSVVLHLSCPAFVDLVTNRYQDRRTRVSGDISIVPALTVCQIRSHEPHDVLVVAISRELMARSTSGRGDQPPAPLLHPYVRDSQLEVICRAFQAEAGRGYTSGTLYGESLALALATHLIRQYGLTEGCSSRKGGMAPSALRRVIGFMEANLETPLRLASLAQIAGLSAYRFAHNFRSAVGLSPHQYVLGMRLARAKRMLRDTDLSIREIAYAVGCQSSSQFNVLFRRETGTVPSVYRASFH